jgi:hypothetical protein
VIVLDTNLLVYAHRSGMPEHAAAQRAIEEACSSPSGCGMTVQTVAEFWSVVTHPAAEGGPARPEEAARFLRSLEDEGGVRVFTPGPGFTGRLAQSAVDLNVRGVRVFDLAIALCALDGGASELWTRDGHFVKVPGLRLRDPLAEADPKRG